MCIQLGGFMLGYHSILTVSQTVCGSSCKTIRVHCRSTERCVEVYRLSSEPSACRESSVRVLDKSSKVYEGGFHTSISRGILLLLTGSIHSKMHGEPSLAI